MVGEGMPVAWVAESFGVKKTALYNRARRNSGNFGEEIGKARGRAKIAMLRKMFEVAEEVGAWQAWSWWQQRFGRVETPGEQARRDLDVARAEAVRIGLDDGGEPPTHDPRFE